MPRTPEAALKAKQIVTHEDPDLPLPVDAELTEERMRRALGLSGPSRNATLTIRGGSPRRPAAKAPAPSGHEAGVADGSGLRAGTVSPLQERVGALEPILAAERQRHTETRQLLQRAELRVRGLEARTLSDAVAQAEALDVERRAVINAQRALNEALFEAQQRDAAGRTAAAGRQTGTSPVTTDQVGPEAAMRPATTSDTVAAPQAATQPVPAKKRGRPRTRPLPEPKPVRWWTPSFQAKIKS